MHSFNDRVVIVTGGGAGIGRAAALQFAAQGARVIVTGRRAKPLQTLATACGNIAFTIVDVANPEDASRTVRDAVDRFGQLDVLVNNARAGAILPLIAIGPQQIAHTFSVNVFGSLLLATAAIPHLEATGESIVNVSSAFGRKADPALSHYAVSKAALEHLNALLVARGL